MFFDLLVDNEENCWRMRKWKYFFKKMWCFLFVRNDVFVIINIEFIVLKDDYWVIIIYLEYFWKILLLFIIEILLLWL